MSKRVALYLRVSTDAQTVENQRLEQQSIADRGVHRARHRRLIRVTATGTSRETRSSSQPGGV